MSEAEPPSRFSYKARTSADSLSRATSASKSRNASGVAELLAKSRFARRGSANPDVSKLMTIDLLRRIEQHRHQQNLRRLPHPDFAATPISSITTSTSYPLPPSPFPLADDQRAPTPSHPSRTRTKKPPGPSAPASWSPIIPDRPLSASTSRNRRDPAEEYERRRGEYELWFRYAYAGEGKEKQSELVGRDLTPAFAKSWLGRQGDAIRSSDCIPDASIPGQDHDRYGSASLQSHAIASFTRYALNFPSATSVNQASYSSRKSEQDLVTDEQDHDPEDPLACIRAVSSVLTEERRICMMLSRAGTLIARKRSGNVARETRLAGILGIWSGWQDLVDERGERNGGRAQLGNGTDKLDRVSSPDETSAGEGSESDDEEVMDDSEDDNAAISEDEDDWDRSSGSREGIDVSDGMEPLPILDLSYLPAVSNAEMKLLRNVLHSTSAYTRLTRLSFAGSEMILSDALNLLPLLGGTRVRSSVNTTPNSAGPTNTSRALRLTHLSLAGMQSRDGKELERAIGKLVRLGAELEMLDLSGIAVFQSFGLWAILGVLFDPEEASALAGAGLRTGGKLPALKVLGLKGLLPSYVLSGNDDVEEAVKTYRAYVTARRPRRWVDLVFL